MGPFQTIAKMYTQREERGTNMHRKQDAKRTPFLRENGQPCFSTLLLSILEFHEIMGVTSQ